MRNRYQIISKRFVPLITGVKFFLATGFTAYGQQPPKPPRPIKFTIVAASKIEFGSIAIANNASGTVVLSTSGIRTVGSGSPVLINSGGITPVPASFTIDAEPGTVITAISVLGGSLTGTSGGSNLSITNPTISVTLPYIIPVSPPTIYIGGTLNILSGTNPGTFSGTFMVSITQR